jgi:1-acyl-sn-glycerol-3-phosphate acyltransferase
MAVTVVPWALAVVVAAPFPQPHQIYWMCVGWLRWRCGAGAGCWASATSVIGWENLPVGTTARRCCWSSTSPPGKPSAMPTLMPHPLAYVFKKELLRVPFFGWAMAAWT